MKWVALTASVLALSGCPGAHDRSDGGLDAADRLDAPVPDELDAGAPIDAATPDAAAPLDAPPLDAPPLHDAFVPVDAARPLDASAGGIGAGRSFRLTFAIAYATPTSRLPSTLSGTVHLAPAAAGSFDATIGSPGVARRMNVLPAPDGTIELSFSWYPPEPVGDCVPVGQIRITARVSLLDDDGDGLADRLDGTSTGMLQEITSDISMSEHTFVANVAGDVEHDPPTFRWVGRAPGHAPLAREDAPRLLASEPFASPTAAWLEAPDGRRVPLMARDSFTTGVASGFDLAEGTSWLPFDVELAVHTDGTVADFDGNVATTLPSLFGLPLPTAISVETFEAAGAHLEGDAERVTGIGSVAAISGARSALVPTLDLDASDGSEVVVRLAVPAGALRVRMRARYLARYASGPTLAWGTPPLEIRVYARDGSMSALWNGPMASSRIATGDAAWPQVSEVLDLDVPLPTGTDGEVVVRIGRSYSCLGMIPFLPTSPLLVDDIRVE